MQGSLFPRLLRLIPVLAILIGLSAGAAHATVITSGCASAQSCSLNELFNGGSIIIDDKRFVDWLPLYDESSIAPDFGAVTVTALDDQALNPGLQFDTNGEFSVVGGDTIDIGLSFTVSTLDGSARIKDNSLEINAYTFGPDNVGGFIDIFEDVLDANLGLVGEKFVTADNLPPPILELFDSAQFSPQSQITVDTIIFLSGDDAVDTVSLDRFTQRFSQIPEPPGLLLLGIGLAGLWLYKKPRFARTGLVY